MLDKAKKMHKLPPTSIKGAQGTKKDDSGALVTGNHRLPQ